jgi:hypothetical protein
MQPQPARENSSEEAARTCHAHLDRPCIATVTTRCEKCDQWFCAEHAGDDEWHACVLHEGDIGGEG